MESKTMMKVMNRFVDKALEKYFCSKCDCFHKRYYHGRLSITFFSHYDYRTKISTTDLFKRSFKKQWSTEAKRQVKHNT